MAQFKGKTPIATANNGVLRITGLYWNEITTGLDAVLPGWETFVWWDSLDGMIQNETTGMAALEASGLFGESPQIVCMLDKLIETAAMAGAGQYAEDATEEEVDHLNEQVANRKQEIINYINRIK